MTTVEIGFNPVTVQREAALAYAGAGARVFPCQPRGKRPITTNGLLDATTDSDVIEAWWTSTPNANPAIRPNEGVVVIDVDPRNGGDRTIAELQERHGALPVTRTARTGGGGWHYWLGLRGQVRSTLGLGVDTKCCSGYVIAPPSIHASGRRYEWINEGLIAPAPIWVVRLLTPPAPIRAVSRRVEGSTRRAERLAETVEQATQGQRNNVLFWACCRALECGLDLNPLVQASVTSGLTETEALRTAASAAGRIGLSA